MIIQDILLHAMGGLALTRLTDNLIDYKTWLMREHLVSAVRQRVALYVRNQSEIEENRLKVYIKGQLSFLDRFDASVRDIINSLVASGALQRHIRSGRPTMIYSNFER